MNGTVDTILCTDNTHYTGIVIDVSRRFNKHAAGRGAKYFRGRQPKQLVYIEPGHNRSSATNREIGLKKMSQVDTVLKVNPKWHNRPDKPHVF